MRRPSMEKLSLRLHELFVVAIYFFLAALMCKFAFGVHGGEETTVPKGAGDSVPSMQLRLMMPLPDQCASSASVQLEAVVTNISNKAFAVETIGIPQSLSFNGPVPSSPEQGVRVKNVAYDPIGGVKRPTRYVILKPGGVVVVPFSVSLRDPFFADSGVYSVQIRYSQFERSLFKGIRSYVGKAQSNEVLFRIRQCPDPPTH